MQLSNEEETASQSIDGLPNFQVSEAWMLRENSSYWAGGEFIWYMFFSSHVWFCRGQIWISDGQAGRAAEQSPDGPELSWDTRYSRSLNPDMMVAESV